MEDSKIQSFPRIKCSSGCWISCRKNVVIEHLEEPTLDYDSWNPDEVAKHNCVRRPFDIYIEDPADGIGRALDLHEQLMKILNDDSLPCDFTNNRWFHPGSEWNTIRNKNSAKYWYGSSASLFYNLFVRNSFFSTFFFGGGGDSELKPNAITAYAGFQAHVQRYEDLTQFTQNRFTWNCMCNVLLIFVCLKHCCVIPTTKTNYQPCSTTACHSCAIINTLQQQFI